MSSGDEAPMPNVPIPISPVAKNYSKMNSEKSPGGLFAQHYERSSKSVTPSASKVAKENVYYKENSEETPANEFSLDLFIKQKANRFIDEINTNKELSIVLVRQEASELKSKLNPYVTPTK